MKDKAIHQIPQSEVGWPSEFCSQDNDEGRYPCDLYRYSSGDAVCHHCGDRFGVSFDDEDTAAMDEQLLQQGSALSFFEEEDKYEMILKGIKDVKDMLSIPGAKKNSIGIDGPINNPFIFGGRFHDIVEMLIDGPKTIEEVRRELPMVNGRKPSANTVKKYLEKDLNLYSDFIVEQVFSDKYSIKARV